MHDDFVSLYAYNRWADRRVLDVCRMLTPEQYVAEPVPGWASIRSSLVHIADVTNAWLRGMAGEVVPGVSSEAELPTVDDASRLLDGAYHLVSELLPRLTPAELTTPRTFSRRGHTAVLPPWAVLRHVVNHATYHRGQIASKLKRFGKEPPVTDFIFWVFEQMKPTG
jgi:uncharacterized damage-inducible protein DinB